VRIASVPASLLVQEQRLDAEHALATGDPRIRWLAMNDDDREQWVQNHEPLYRAWQEAGGSLRAWVRANRELIDSTAARERNRKPLDAAQAQRNREWLSWFYGGGSSDEPYDLQPWMVVQ